MGRSLGVVGGGPTPKEKDGETMRSQKEGLTKTEMGKLH